ncbi:MAG: efflux RND transporter permease subunit [Pikeienuella sp.]
MAEAGKPTSVFGYFVRHRTAANLILLLMLVGGLYAATQLRSQFFPDSVRESVSVNVAWPGAGPEDVDSAIVSVIEPRLLAVEGVEDTISLAREGSARMTISFEDGWDMGRATDEVKAAVDAIRTLPESAEEPVVRRGAFRDKITDVVIHGPADPAQLTRYATEFQAKLFAAGITRTTLRGVEDPIIRVAVPEASMVRYDITLAEVAAAISGAVDASPAGDVGAGATRIRTGAERRSAEDIGDITLRTSSDGERLYVRDLAEISIEGAAKGIAYYWGDNPAVTISVDRSASGDSIKLQAAVQRMADEFAETLPAGVEVQLTRTRAQAISDRLNILLENGAFGLGLVLLFLFLFLSARTAFWVAMGIPAAMAATLGIMWLSGITLNMVSLFALILCLGIVVDDAIVVGEHADFLERKGLSPAQAAEQAARRMAAPVFAASLTTIIAFSALVIIGGRFGSLIIDIPLTVCAVLAASLVECFLILPAHMKHALAARNKRRWYDWPSRVFDRGFRWVRERAFRPFAVAVIRARYLTLGVAVFALLYSVSMFFTGDVRWRFFNAPERGTVDANIAMLPGSTRADTRAQLSEMQDALDRVNEQLKEKHGVAPVEYAIAQIGGSAGWRGLSGADAKDPDLLGALSVTLIDPDLRTYTQSDVIRAWQAEVRRLPKLETLAMFGGRSGPGGDAIDVKLIGTDPQELKDAAEAMKLALSAFPVVSALEDTLAYDKAELVLTLTPRGEALGLSPDGIGRELRDRLSGIEAAEFLVNSRAATVEVSLPEADLTADYVARARIRTPEGGFVALSEVVEVSGRFGFAAVRREDGFPVVRVSGDVAEDDPVAADNVSTALADVIIPDILGRFDVQAEISGLAEQERDFLNDAMIGFMLCVLGIYLSLAWVFASWLRPLVVILVIPFGAVGAIWGHFWFGIPLSMFSIVGLIGMAGIIVNDSIVLVTTIDEYAERRGLLPALIDGVVDRLRPVLLTTLTTVAGLTPLLYETSRQAQFLKPTVITLAFGLAFGMMLVLLVTPAMVAVQHDIGRAMRSARRGFGQVRRRRKGLGGMKPS